MYAWTLRIPKALRSDVNAKQRFSNLGHGKLVEMKQVRGRGVTAIDEGSESAGRVLDGGDDRNRKQNIWYVLVHILALHFVLTIVQVDTRIMCLC